MSEEKKPTNLEEVIEDMISTATKASLEAWSKLVELESQDKYNGAIPVPEDGRLKSFARKWFLTGYSLALTDHVMKADTRLNAAAEKDYSQNKAKIVM